MPMVNIAGKEVEVDEEGYLVDLSQWNEDIAKYMAVEEKVDLTDATGKSSTSCASTTPSTRSHPLCAF